MRLRRLDLVRYGKFTDQTIDFGERTEAQPDFHIIYGPNEAGKSTAFTAFLDLLFGIELQSRYGFLHPYTTMRIGACLELSVGTRELVRIKRPSPTLRDGSDQPITESLILGDLGGLDRNAYRSMFSLDDDTLEAGGKSILASNGELGQLLFSASTGLAELSKTLTNLRLETEGFCKPYARSGELLQLKAALAALKAERDAIDTLASDYNRLAAARDNAASRYEAALTERSQVQARLVTLQRLLTALPRLTALRQTRLRLVPLQDVPPAPAGWLAELPCLQDAETAHRMKIELGAADIKRLADELAEMTLDESALRLAGSLDQLTERRARYHTAQLDLPTRRRELERANSVVADVLKRLGCEAEPAPSRLLLTAAQTAALRSLIETRSGIGAAIVTARNELSDALHQLEEARRTLHQVTGTTDASAPNRLAAVTAALAALRESDHAIRLRNATRTQSQHRDLLEGELAALAPWSGTVAELSVLPAPDATTVRAWETATEHAEALVARRTTEVERLDSDLVQRRAELEAMGSIAGLVNDQQAGSIRSAREAAWAEHRRTLDPGSADAFEAALRHDDAVGSARLGHERDLAKLHERGQALLVKQAESDYARRLLNDAAVQLEDHRDNLRASLAALGLKPSPDASPAGLMTWVTRREQVLDRWHKLQQARRDAADAEADAAAIRKRLGDALALAAVPVGGDAGLEALAAAAQSAIDGQAHLQAQRLEVSERERALSKRERALQKEAVADKAWHIAWRDACASCWLATRQPDWPVETVREVLAALGELGPAVQAQSGLADRIRSMEADEAEFEQELGRVTGALGIDLTRGSKLDIAQSVEDRIQKACRTRDARTRVAEALAAAHETHRLAAQHAALHAARIAEMTTLYQVGSLMEVAGRLRDAERKTELEAQAGDAEREILTTLAAPTLADAEAALETMDQIELQVEHDQLNAQLEDLDARTRELFAAGRKAADKIEAVGGDGAVARIEEKRRTTLLEIGEKAQRYLRIRVGIAAADRALRAYRDQHRSSMMTQASEAFRMISRGAYRGLATQPDKDGDMLVALGEDGSSKLATDLSKGTRFQLYLALRAAGYQEFAKQRRPVPFIADDIMETFDDFRAEEALRVFGDMARIGQVIYLTHHDHLCAIAQRVSPHVRIHTLAAA
jgi:uncharacterized protein YhaN